MTSENRLDRIEAILAATAQQQQANTEAINRLEVQTQANTQAIDRLTDRIDRLTSHSDWLTRRVDGLIEVMQLQQEGLRQLQRQSNDFRDHMEQIRLEIRDIWRYLNNQLRNRGNGDG